MPSFSRLIRFLARDGRVYYGDALLPRGVTDVAQATQARIVRGSVFGQHTVTDEVAEVRTLLAPLAPEDVRTVRCLGLNYAQHAKESGMAVPQYPVLFYKPATSLGGPGDAIPVSAAAQEGGAGLDYECELVAVIGRACKDVAAADALDAVLGYAVGNDVSHRGWQLQRGGGQWSLGKGFDGWAPWGPGIVTARALAEQGLAGPQALAIQTTLNGRVVQASSTADMIFGVAEAISFLSRGTTLQPGDVVFTGTPAGVGMGRTPPVWLQDGDVVAVSLEGVGTCTNRVVFEGERPKL